MKSSTIRTIVAAVVFAVLAICLIVGVNAGTISGLGPDIIATICPLGALETMLASKTLIPRGIISIVVLGVIVFLVGRAFCAWICPVGLWDKILKFFRSPKTRRAQEKRKQLSAHEIATLELAMKHDCGSCKSSCATKRPKFDSRHGVLLGALLSSAIFGFPVFCLLCPIGLSFATVLLVWRLFAFGDATITIVLVIAILVIELIFLRKWCSKFCPLSALMNLVGRANRTVRPIIDEKKCLESVNGTPCSQCAIVCEYDINLRHPDGGERTLADCSRCRACIDACPAHAISMPFYAKKQPEILVAATKEEKKEETPKEA